MHRIGIDIGGTSCKLGVVDIEGRIIQKSRVETDRRKSPEEMIDGLGKACIELIENSCVKMSDIQSVGIGCPGTPDKKNGVLVYANNINFYNTDIRGIISRHVNKDIFIDNDANCAALAESIHGACKCALYSFTITLGTGVGSGAVLDGRLYSGFNYGAPELGHMVIQLGGRKCTCGRRGCWEQYSSANALIEDTKEAIISSRNTVLMDIIGGDLANVSAKTAFVGMRMGDGVSAKVVETYINRLAHGLANVINIFQPEIIALGGGVSNEGKVLLEMLDPIIKQEIYTRMMENNCRIVLATMGNDAGIIGASLLDE